MTCCVKYYMHIKHRHHSSLSHHIHIIIHYYYCGWVMCTLVQYTGRRSQNIEVFHHIHTTYCTLVMSGLLELKKKIKKVTHSGSNKPMVGFIGTFHIYCVLGHSANAEDTILAGRSAASPKAPPYGSL